MLTACPRSRFGTSRPDAAGTRRTRTRRKAVDAVVFHTFAKPLLSSFRSLFFISLFGTGIGSRALASARRLAVARGAQQPYLLASRGVRPSRVAGGTRTRHAASRDENWTCSPQKTVIKS